jgi:ankyrin repeat protein
MFPSTPPSSPNLHRDGEAMRESIRDRPPDTSDRLRHTSRERGGPDRERRIDARSISQTRATWFRWAIVGLFVASVSAQTETSREALFAAIRGGAVSDVARALANGASVNAVDADGVPALMAATLFADAQMVELLLTRGADPNRTGPAGTTALMWAVPSVEKARLLIAHGANVNARSDTDRTPLLVAASYPRTVDVLRVLLDRGADLRAQDRAGTTALALAVRSADVEVVRFLVEKGLDPSALSPGALRSGFARYDRSTTEYVMTKGPGTSPDLLITTAAWQPTGLLSRWIESGANVNASAAGQYGRTPLLTAVTSEAESADALRLLLDHGADPNVGTTEGELPLDWAIYSGDEAKARVLGEHGAKRGNGPRREEIPPPVKGGIGDPRLALTRSVSRLFDAAPGFREKTNCISCHHNAMPALAAAAARSKGIEIDEARARKNLDDIVSFFKSNAPRMMLGDPAVGGEALTTGYAQMALSAEGHPLDTVTATMTHWLLARQMPDGRWLGNGLNRPPSEYSTISHTAIAAGGLKLYPIPGRKKEMTASLQRARDWLLAAQPASAEERAMRLMGLVWTDAPRSRVSAAATEVRDRQEAGGGWSQFARTDADAYATGLSLYALHVAGVAPTDPAYRKGVAFLLGTQYQDGAWLVKTHSFPVQRYFESGFPFGRHQWISAAGTSWASLAIAQTLPGASRDRQPTKRP